MRPTPAPPRNTHHALHLVQFIAPDTVRFHKGISRRGAEVHLGWIALLARHLLAKRPLDLVDRTLRGRRLVHRRGSLIARRGAEGARAGGLELRHRPVGCGHITHVLHVAIGSWARSWSQQLRVARTRRLARPEEAELRPLVFSRHQAECFSASTGTPGVAGLAQRLSLGK